MSENADLSEKDPSLSDVQQDVEKKVLARLRKKPGYGDLESNQQIHIGPGFCQPDGVDRKAKVPKVVEIFARVGEFNSGQHKKVATDILKLAAVRQQEGFENARCEIYFVDKTAMESVRGWMKAAADEFDVKLVLVDGFPKSLIRKLKQAQLDQGTRNTRRD